GCETPDYPYMHWAAWVRAILSRHAKAVLRVWRRFGPGGDVDGIDSVWSTQDCGETRIMKLTHLDEQGAANMVDVSGKAVTTREARAEAYLHLQPETLQLILEGKHKKGDVFAVARIAGIQAAKKCGDLIPLCHPLMLTAIKVEIEPQPEQNRIRITTLCRLDR